MKEDPIYRNQGAGDLIGASEKSKNKVKIFISYSHKDEQWKDLLVTHLEVLEQEGIVEVWDDSKILPSQDWQQEIQKNLKEADITILLISAEFLGSDFIKMGELPIIMEHRKKYGMKVLPLIIKHCAWREVNWLSTIQEFPKKNIVLEELSSTQINKKLSELTAIIRDIAKAKKDGDTQENKLHEAFKKLFSAFRNFFKKLPLLPFGLVAILVVVLILSRFFIFKREPILSNTSAAIKIEDIRNDFENLKNIQSGISPKDQKIAKCRDILSKYQNVPKNDETESMVREINKYIDQLEAEISAEQYQQYIDSGKIYLQSGALDKARDSLNRARELNDTPEVRKLLDIFLRKQIEKTEYDSIRENPTLAQYLGFLAKYPNSTYKPDLKNKLMRLEKNLPPEKYWHRGINKNVKGYYEYKFDNGHTMIYIPGRIIWIDKYEVSWRQFKTFDSKYIDKEDDFPAMVNYSEAEVYCIKNGLRISSQEEWEYAANAGMNLKYPYPWGIDMPDANGIYRANFDKLDAGIDKDGYLNTAPVRSFEEFSSPFGVVNMAGNVWEWVQGKVLKGGGYLSSSAEDLRIAAPSRGGDNGRQGFRCVKDEKR